MIKPALAAFAVLIPLMPAARAAEPPFTPAQRQAIIGIVRDALRSDPSILRDAITALQNQEGAERQQTTAAAIAAHRAEIFADATDATAGDPRGDVTLVEFYDPRCPYCRRMVPVIADLLKDDPHLRVVYKDLPILGPASTVESRALLAAARQGGYLRMQQAIMQGPNASALPGTEAAMRGLAAQIGLDPQRLAADMNDPAIQRQLAANIRLAQQMGIEGTPAMVLGGPGVRGAEPFFSGALDLSDLRQAVAAARG